MIPSIPRDENSEIAECPQEFSWMENLRNQSPCMVAGFVQNACNDGSDASLPRLSPNEQYPLPNSRTSNVCTCSWAYYNLMSACSACQGGEIIKWDAYQHACGSSTTASAWSGAVSYFPPNINLSDSTALPYWASINPAKWANGRFDVETARKMRNQGHEDVGSSGPSCSAGFEWLLNERDQSPCQVAASIQGICSDSNTQIIIPPIPPQTIYPLQTVDECSCSWTYYNLISACTLCQHPSTPVLSWENYTAACSALESGTSYYPTERPIPFLPFWAITDPTSWPNHTFDLNVAQSIHSQGHPDLPQSAPLPASGPPINSLVDMTVGALEIGVVVSIFLFGVMTKQTINYYNRYPHDAYVLKLLVAVVWSFECAHAVALSHGTYLMTVDESLAPASISLAFLFSGIIGALVQAYFSLRIQILSGNRFLSLFLIVLAVSRFVGWIIVGIIGSLPADRITLKLSNAWRWMLTALLVANALVDLAITVYLCVYYRIRRKGSFRSTIKLLDQLINWTLQNGLITSVAGILTAVFFHTSYQTSLWVAIFAVLTRLFSNSFLASVNAREQLRSLANNASTSMLSSDNVRTVIWFAQPVDRPGVDLYSHSYASDNEDDETL